MAWLWEKWSCSQEAGGREFIYLGPFHFLFPISQDSFHGQLIL